MYQITVNGAYLGLTDSPEYCYKLPSGSPQVIGYVERGNGAVATGIIFQGTVYNLPEHSDFEGAETAYVSEVDEGAILTQHTEQIKQEQSTIGGAKADRMYEEGELLTIGGTLYRVLIPIPAGGGIAVGANVEETTIVKELSKI